MEQGIVIAYSATSISILARFVFMYLLYTKKSINPYSLLFCILNIASSSLWITYSRIIIDIPLLVRGSSDLLLFIISAHYILYNRYNFYNNNNFNTIENSNTTKRFDNEIDNVIL